MSLRRLSCHAVIVASFALMAFALAEWQARGFSIGDVWPIDGEMRVHPAHVLLLGIVILPPALFAPGAETSSERGSGRGVLARFESVPGLSPRRTFDGSRH